MRQLQADHFPGSLDRLPWLCCDGIPVEVVIHRQLYQGLPTFCNLADAMRFLSLHGKSLVERWRGGSGGDAPPVVPLACLLADLALRGAG